MLILAGTMTVDPARRDEYLAAQVPVMEATRAEAGCLDYVMTADPIVPERVCLFERWESRAHLDQHLAGVRAAPTAADASGSRARPLDTDLAVYEISSADPFP
jgi:quinol monooxygenase YgiN